MSGPHHHKSRFYLRLFASTYHKTKQGLYELRRRQGGSCPGLMCCCYQVLSLKLKFSMRMASSCALNIEIARGHEASLVHQYCIWVSSSVSVPNTQSRLTTGFVTSTFCLSFDAQSTSENEQENSPSTTTASDLHIYRAPPPRSVSIVSHCANCFLRTDVGVGALASHVLGGCRAQKLSVAVR